MTVAQAKTKIIAQIKRRRGLFENIGDKELRQLQSQNEFGWWDDKCEGQYTIRIDTPNQVLISYPYSPDEVECTTIRILEKTIGYD